MGANVGIVALIGTIVMVVIGLMMLGLIEEGVSNALTVQGSWSYVAVAATETAPLVVKDGTSAGAIPWYANKLGKHTNDLSLPPKFSTDTECAVKGVVILSPNRTGIKCSDSTGTLAAGTLLGITEKTGEDATALSIFKIAPFLFLLGAILLTMVATAFTSVVGSGTNIRDVIIRAVTIFVGFMLIETITDSLGDAREIFSYAVEYTGMSGGFSLVILLYAITLIIGLIGTARAGYQEYKKGGGAKGVM